VDRKINAILIQAVDDVATAIVEFQTGDIGKFVRNGELVEVAIAENIPKYHKFAVRDIAKSEAVRKYGEIIGLATQNCLKGSHVHEHNLASPDSSQKC
jgi:hypothetical protein